MVIDPRTLVLVSFVIFGLNLSAGNLIKTPPLKNRTTPKPCENWSCSPAPGNLLVGRESQLTASSTCGLNGPEHFCTLEFDEKKCFLCDSRSETKNDPFLSHKISQIITRYKPKTSERTWWQSENGKEAVTVQLNLEAEFQINHVIIQFQTIRPAAMLVEHSYDFGRTWHVYRYFASNCSESFPIVLTESNEITDALCEQQSLEPSGNGDIILEVLPFFIDSESLNTDHVQNMMRTTNLRINFTKLHSFENFYTISNMDVGGVCLCNGHAPRCLPLLGYDSQKEDDSKMVHGRCECVHNTKGLNCEYCEDLYNDLPWKRAVNEQTNACKNCNCNNHAISCHFDKNLYEFSGKISGGVCDNCEHNTQGRNCEECKPFFYRDPNEDFESPSACKPCDCDLNGALHDFCLSDADHEPKTEAGACQCKTNVEGRRCDVCKGGYKNLSAENPDGCELM